MLKYTQLGKCGPRHFINVDVMGRTAKLSGTPKQIAAIQFAGFNFPEDAVTDGVTFNIPCRVKSKQNENYLTLSGSSRLNMRKAYAPKNH